MGVDVLVYLDDVLMFASDAAALVDAIREVLQLLMSAGLKCKPFKCALFSERVHYFGHIVTTNEIESDSIKIDEILQWPHSVEGRELSSFF